MRNAARSNVKYTAMLPEHQIRELKRLADMKIIPSVNSGIRTAVEQFVSQTKKEQYEELMAQAASDKRFMKRTLEAQDEFEDLDCEVGGQW